MVINGLKSGWLEESAQMIQTFYGLTPFTSPARTMNVVLQQGAPGGTLAYVQTGWSISGSSATLSALSLHIELADFAPSTGDRGENIMTQNGILMYNDRIIAHEMAHAVMADALGDDFFDMPTWFKEGTAEFIHGADERLKADIAAAGGVQNIVERAVDLMNGAAWAGTSRDYSASYLAVKYIQSNLTGGSSFADIMAGINDDDDNTEMTMDSIIANTTFADQADLQNSLAANGAAYYGSLSIDVGAEADTGWIGGSDHGGAAKTAEDVVANGVLSANPTNFNVVFPVVSSDNESFTIQMGANSGQTVGIALTSVKVSDLGLSGVDVRSDASTAITRFDDAIAAVSSSRSLLGAMQNRLEHAVKANENTSENLQSSESRIRDVDMAKEMMGLTKNNILQQAAQAMLAQANQQPQGILQLLR